MEQLFQINARTSTLKFNDQDGKSTILNGDKYVVPIYQRPYSWTDEQIKKLCIDIFKGYISDGIVHREPMFIGTMQLSAKNHDGKYEVIDGQQRLTTFLLMLKAIEKKYCNCPAMEGVSFDWLRTEVNNGLQQTYLTEALEGSNNGENPYVTNLTFINLQIAKLEDFQSENEPFDANDFITYLLSKVYFVVIETRADLTKTLQIFNAINTTGLDLAGGDIFKIKMYEYLTKKGENKDVFERISNLYHKLDTEKVADINSILSIYQYIIISRHNLTRTLLYLNVNTFFERLFDVMFDINHWDGFNNVKNVVLSLDEIEGLIDIRHSWEKNWRSGENFSAEDACTLRLIWWSRYGRYWNLIFVFLDRYKNDENCWDNMLYFTRQLNKLFTIYSVRYQKIKNDIYYGFMQSVIDAIVNKPFVDVMSLINNKIGKEEDQSPGQYDLNWLLSEELTENAKRKNIVCRLSAMLDEDYTTTNPIEVKMMRHQLFDVSIDIEHIESYNHKDEAQRKAIQQLWGANLNSLGNLMILEYDINRSISNHNYPVKTSSERTVSYHASKFKTVKNQLATYSEWDLDKCKGRKVTETRKILDYLFS